MIFKILFLMGSLLFCSFIFTKYVSSEGKERIERNNRIDMIYRDALFEAKRTDNDLYELLKAIREDDLSLRERDTKPLLSRTNLEKLVGVLGIIVVMLTMFNILF